MLLSEYVFADIKITGVANTARNVHMLCAYWVFILMSLHLGLHWNMFLRMHFVFFDYTEPLIFFMLDYIAVMGLFIAVGYYLGTFLKKNYQV